MFLFRPAFVSSLWLLPASLWAQSRQSPVVSGVPGKKIEYFDKKGARLSSVVGADYYTETTYQDSVAATVRSYYPSGKTQSIDSYTNLRRDVRHGTRTVWYESGQVRRQEPYVAGSRHGQLTSYYADGTLRRREQYDHGVRKSGECFGPTGQPVAYVADEPPGYPGGQKKLVLDLQRGVRYPAPALRAGVSGRVRVLFAIEADGSLGQVQIVESPSPLLNEAVVQAVKALSGFTAAQQDGEAVRGTFSCPVTFQLVPSASPVVPLAPLGPVQPLAPVGGHQLVEKLASFRDSTYRLDKKVGIVYQHYFTYDRQGRPQTHRLDYLSNGRPASSTVYRYEYRPDGKLAAKISNSGRVKYEFQYDQSGRLTTTRFLAFEQQQWVAYEETTLREKAVGPAGSRVLTLTMQKRQANILQPYCEIDYRVSAENSITSSTTFSHNYKKAEQPMPVLFIQDDKANPFQDLLVERWYQVEFERSGPHNLLYQMRGGRPFNLRTYQYDQGGRPTQCAIRGKIGDTPYRVQRFTYAKIAVPAPSLAGPAADSVNTVAVFPNPAVSTTLIRAARIGKGEATLRLFSAETGKLHRQLTYPVATTFEATVSVVGLEKGLYVVEITGNGTVVKGKLAVE